MEGEWTRHDPIAGLCSIGGCFPIEAESHSRLGRSAIEPQPVQIFDHL